MEKLRGFLDDNDVEYIVMSHSRAYTAQRIAAAAHIPGKELAKTVILQVDGELMMCVLPAPEKVSLLKVKELTGADSVDLASEEEFGHFFPDCELGAMPPFGNLYGMTVIADKKLADDEEIFFNACSHRDLIRMGYKDFARLVKPRLGNISVRD